MIAFAIWFEESPCKISKGDGSNVGFATCYIDDIIVFSPTSEDHMHHL
jgi:hypothetical protein